MTKLLPLLIVFTVLCQKSFAIPVYRSQTSLFPSGDLSAHKLNAHIQRSQVKKWLKIKLQMQTGWIEEDSVFKIWEFVREVKSIEQTPLRSNPRWSEQAIHVIGKGETAYVVAEQEDWLHVQTLKGGHLAWVPKSAMVPDPKDLGVVHLLEGHSVRRAQVVDIQDGSLKVKDRAKGFELIPVTKMLSLLNFVHGFSNSKGTEFKPVLRLTAQGFLLKPSGRIELQKDLFKIYNTELAFIKKSGTRILADPHPNSAVISLAPQGASLQILSHKRQVWNLSQLSSSAEPLWWTEDLEKSKTPQIHSLQLSHKELFQRKIFAMETAQSIKGFMIASAKGVFISRNNGQTWRQVPYFGEGNFPISISGNGTLYVGGMRSQDQGESFQEYLPWHQISKTLAQHGLLQPKHLDLRQIRILDKNGVALEVKISTGDTLERFLSADGGLTWQLSLQ